MSIALDPWTDIVEIGWGNKIKYLALPFSLSRVFDIRQWEEDADAGQFGGECAVFPYGTIQDPVPEGWPYPNDIIPTFPEDLPGQAATYLYLRSVEYRIPIAAGITQAIASRDGTTWSGNLDVTLAGVPADPGVKTVAPWNIVGWDETFGNSLSRMRYPGAHAGGTTVNVPSFGGTVPAGAKFKSGASINFESVGQPFNPVGSAICFAPFVSGWAGVHDVPLLSGNDLYSGLVHAGGTLDVAGMSAAYKGKTYNAIGHYSPENSANLFILFEVVETP